MNRSLKLGKIFGIEFFIHPTFWLLPLIVLMISLRDGLGMIVFELLFVFALFACVALHELGHALAAAAYGIRTRHITLYPIGGVAALERMPEKPAREIAVALAGPAVNVVIALALLFGIIAGGLFVQWEPTDSAVDMFIARLFLANVILVAFNLLPCFPMDGGRVLRAILSVRMDRLRATETAVKVGTVVAVLMVVVGLVGIPGVLPGPNFGLILVAVVVWLLGQAELAAVRLHEGHRAFERRAREMYGLPPEPDFEAVPRPTPRAGAAASAPAARPAAETAADLAARRFSGLAWDSDRLCWVQWVNGVPVRDIPA